MYERRYGLIRTLAPLHVGASAGEEAGNLNLIFRDAFTRTGIIPGSSIRGRFRADMRMKDKGENTNHHVIWYGAAAGDDKSISEARVKFEHASVIWLPVFCPGQPVVWVSSPMLLRRYAAITGDSSLIHSCQKLKGGTCNKHLNGVNTNGNGKVLFFNLGFMTLTDSDELTSKWIPEQLRALIPEKQLVLVEDSAIGAIHDMALYRQSRVRLEDEVKRAEDGGFFLVEALPEQTAMIFPIAIRSSTDEDDASTWQPLGDGGNNELYFGGLESIGFGRCEVYINTVPAKKMKVKS
jgi:CRISPR-associated protein Cmr4